MSKLAIVEEREEDRYDTITRVICYACLNYDMDRSSGDLPAVIEGVMNAMTFAKREEVKAWEQEFVPCEHTLGLNQHEPKQIGSQDLSQCSMCSLKENLWLCLECGNLGCGRSQFGGIGGNSHALAHSDMTSHSVAVKLGSITADGTADIYCYACNEERIDPNLGPHLAHWGINLMAREKTEKSLMEMQVEHNLKWDFSMTTEDGHELTPVFGPGLTGLANLGNSCYLSSVLQCIFDLPEFQHRYYHEYDEPPFTRLPAEDLETQMRKIADGILSGRYSQADKDTAATSDLSGKPHQKGLTPTMFKHLVGRGHEEFSTMRQQDAFEFLLHIFKLINLAKHSDHGENPIKAFDFAMEQRLQCLSCQKVRYKVDAQDNVSIPVPARRLTSDDSHLADSFAPVTLYDCLDAFTSEEKVQLDCPSCKANDGFSKRSSFRTLPQHLVVNARRFEIVNWVPTKLEIPVEVSDQAMDLSQYLSGGQRANEELLPDINNEESFTPNEIALDQLLSMGFPKARCEKALYMTGNTDAEAGMNWLFAHMDDDDIDEPLVTSESGTSSDASYDAAKIAQLGEMGIEESRAMKALAATGGDVVRAIDWVFSHPDALIEDETQSSDNASSSQPRVPGFDSTPARYQLRSIICHKGSSIHAGHYVAFIRKALPGQDGLSWVLFNDEKVVKVEDIQEMKKHAYLYFFSRV
ncbi:ubiquitin-specific protease UBP14 [Aspergillus affinis]|uniref:ubiquitin-specific protease UBP14 n=1 Tax=Aspergillus affinis TaxID=1070780 RepID=UPI0022FF2F9A|nr:ubiquitinyl hydrolase [Aspergillus affinis]KAI9034819.1 ubiquitinyl hydrolase [Aspergillus affinis]